MSTFKDTVKKWMKESEISRDYLASMCGVGKRTVDAWLSSVRDIPQKAEIIINQLMEESRGVQRSEDGKNILEIEFSDDEMKIVDEFQRRFPGINIENYCRDKTIELCVGVESALSSIEDNERREAAKAPEINNEFFASKKEAGKYEIFEVGNIAAGNLINGDREAEPKKHVTSKEYPDGSYALRVCGTSMEPEIMNEDIIVVKKWNGPGLPKDGTIVVYWDGRGVTLKKFKMINGIAYFSSINPLFPEIRPIDGGSISAVYVDNLTKGE